MLNKIKEFFKSYLFFLKKDKDYSKGGKIEIEIEDNKEFNKFKAFLGNELPNNIYDQLNILSPEEIAEAHHVFKSLIENSTQYLAEKRKLKETYENLLNTASGIMDLSEANVSLEELKSVYNKIEEDCQRRVTIYSNIMNKLAQFEGIVELNKK